MINNIPLKLEKKMTAIFQPHPQPQHLGDRYISTRAGTADLYLNYDTKSEIFS